MIDAIQSELGLTKEYVEPSRAALYRYGNVSSSSIWYVLSFIEHFRGVRSGDRVLQIAFGSGFKCNSAVWVANRRVSEKTHTWEVREQGARRKAADSACVQRTAILRPPEAPVVCKSTPRPCKESQSQLMCTPSHMLALSPAGLCQKPRQPHEQPP